MKTPKLKNCLFAIAVIAIILVAGGYQLPKYASRLTVIAALALIDMLYWKPVWREFDSNVKLLSFAYWLPMALLLLFFVSGYFFPYQNWPPFLRVYFPGLLLIALIGKGIFLIFVLVGEIVFLPKNYNYYVISRRIKRGMLWRRSVIFIKMGAVVAATVSMVFVSGMFFWVRDLKLNTVELPVKNLPEAFDGYRIVQVSDLHLGSLINEKPLKRIVDLSNSLQPDIVLFTGDLLNFTTKEALPFEELMKLFSAKDGKFAVLGNHDYGEYSPWDSQTDKMLNDSALIHFYKKTGWDLLRNKNSIIHRDSASLAIIGVENWSKNKRFGKKGNLKKALVGIGNSQFNILLSHDPTHWDAEVNKKYPQINLTLSGHTHAFQMAIETASFKCSPASFLFEQWAGLYEHSNKLGGKQFLYVNRGAGTLGYPGRIGTRPEITLIVLKKAD